MTQRVGQLFTGDNLPHLKALSDESVDLAYLDPPFNSGKNYNTFSDKWKWEKEHQDILDEIKKAKPLLGAFLENTKDVEGKTMTAYLCFMCLRLIEVHRVLKETGSVWLQCDDTADYLIQYCMSIIFGRKNFRNKVVWRRSPGKSFVQRKLSRNIDYLLFYTKGNDYTFNIRDISTPYDEDNLPESIRKQYRYTEKTGRRYAEKDLTSTAGRTKERRCQSHNMTENSNKEYRKYKLADVTWFGGESRPASQREYMLYGVTRTWRWTKKRMRMEICKGRVIRGKLGTVPRCKTYLDEQVGIVPDCIWSDIKMLQGGSKENVSWATQKPEALIRRVILASSNKGDVVLDPFAGSGTTATVAQQEGREWILMEQNTKIQEILKERIPSN